MSILSMFEVAFWLLRLLSRICTKGKNDENDKSNEKNTPNAERMVVLDNLRKKIRKRKLRSISNVP